MNTKNIITLDNLTADSVSVKTQRTLLEDNNIETLLGEPHRKAYINSESGRQKLVAEVEEPYKSAILNVWGSTPTVTETEE